MFFAAGLKKGLPGYEGRKPGRLECVRLVEGNFLLKNLFPIFRIEVPTIVPFDFGPKLKISYFLFVQ
jgi:hypothetical protein